MAMRNPPHPGGILRRQCLEPFGLSVTEAAKGLGVTRQALSDLLNGKAGRVGRHGDPPRQGVRVEPGDLARPADRLRSVAGALAPSIRSRSSGSRRLERETDLTRAAEAFGAGGRAQREAQLADCLGDLGFADEIVVVLDRSTDDSAARSRGASRPRWSKARGSAKARAATPASPPARAIGFSRSMPTSG